MQELQSTYEALQQSRLACEERDYLIATHERSEAALASHASALTAELQQAAANMSSLFNRYSSACLFPPGTVLWMTHTSFIRATFDV